MHIVTADQMRAIEGQTIGHYGVPALLLMENAGRAVAALAWRLLIGAPVPPECGPGPRRLKDWWPAASPRLGLPGRVPSVLAFAGKGNNGGDVLCAARHLHNWGLQVAVVLWADPEALPPDARLNWDACCRAGIPRYGAKEAPDLLRNTDLVLDGLLGTGVRGPARGPVRSAIALLAESGRPVLAVDLPSGVDSDTGALPGPAVSATWTLALGLPKPAHVLYPGAGLCGEVWVADIGVPGAAVSAAGQAWRTVVPGWVGRQWPRLPADTHKGSRGRVLVAGGCRAMPGAPALAGTAALRAGAGLVTVAVPEPAGDLVAGWAPELITHRLPAGPDGEFAPEAMALLHEQAGRVGCLVVGPGLGTGAAARRVARELVLQSPVPVVVDADGIRAFAGEPERLRQARAPVILTPHPAELGALLGTETAAVQADRPGALGRAVAGTGQTVLLKGAHTLVGEPGGQVWVNLTGHRTLATAGSGDVLTGIIAALVVQGLDPALATVAGACLHGLAGERLAQRSGADGILASDLARDLPGARAALAQLGERPAW